MGAATTPRTRPITAALTAALTGMGGGGGIALPQPRDEVEFRYLNTAQGLAVGDPDDPLVRMLGMNVEVMPSFESIRAIYGNWCPVKDDSDVPVSTTPMNILGACVYSPTARAHDGTTYATKPNLTFDGGSTTKTVPLGTQTGGNNQFIRGLAITDKITQASGVRSDGGTLAIARIRTLFSDNSYINSVLSSVINAASYNTGGVYYGRHLQSVNAASMKTVDESISDAGGSSGPDSVILGPVGGAAAGWYSLYVGGDSLHQSANSDSTTCGWAQRLGFLARDDGAKLAIANYAISGQKHETTLEMFYARMALGCLPSMAAIAGHSINSANDQAGFDASWARVQEFVAYCDTNGIIPVVCYNPPSQGISTSLFVTQNARLASLPAHVIKLDFFTPITIAGEADSTYYNADGVHGNPARDLAWANVGKTAFQAIGIW